MEGVRARRLLKSMTIKQGVKFDSPESVREILPFVAFHGLNVDEFLEPVESFRESIPISLCHQVIKGYVLMLRAVCRDVQPVLLQVHSTVPDSTTETNPTCAGN